MVALILGLLVALIWSLYVRQPTMNDVGKLVVLSKQNSLLEKSLFENIKMSSQIPKNVADVLHESTTMLIYRYAHGTCTACYLQDLFDLQDFQIRIGANRVLVLPDWPKSRNDIIQLKSDLNGLRFINLSSDSLSIPKSERGDPMRYFAVLEPNGNINMVFYPNSSYPQLTQKYFEKIIGLFELSENYVDNDSL